MHTANPTPTMDSEYLELLENMLRYWLSQTKNLHDGNLDAINEEVANISQTIEQGLQQPQTVPLVADLLIQTKRLSERRGYWYKWREHIEKALTFETLTSLQRTKLLNQIGWLCNFLFKLDDAITYHLAAKELAQQNNFYEEWAHAEANLCNDYRKTTAYELGEKSGQSAVNLCQKYQIKNWVNGFTHGRLGFLYSQWGKPIQAMPHLEKAKDIFSQIDEQTHYAETISNIGGCLDLTGQNEDALQQKLSAESIIATTHNEFSLAEINNDLGVSYTLLNQYDLATEKFRLALFSYQKLNVPFQIAHTANNLADCLTRQGKISNARFYIQLSQPYFKSQNDLLNLANSYSILGYIEEQEGNLGKAQETYALGLMALKNIAHSHAKEIYKAELQERASRLQP